MIDYCDYNLSLKLRDCGFDEPCIAQWACEPDGKPMLLGSTAFVFSNAELKGRDVTAPLLFHAQKWLRNKCGLHVAVYPCMDSASDADSQVCDEWQFWFFDIMQVSTARFLMDGEGHFDSYEQALSEGIKSALELIKKGE